MTEPCIAVTGATGKTGSATVEQLLRLNQSVRAVVRVADRRSQALARLGAEVVVADLYDPQQMSEALAGSQRAYYCPPMTPHAVKTLTAFAYAVEANRLEAVVAMSQWLASPRHPALLTRDMWDVEQLLGRLPDMAVTVLNPGFFADNYLRVSLAMAAQLGVYANFVGDSRNAPASNQDMARVAAAVLADPAPHAGHRYRITGPALIGANEIVAALSTVLARKVRRLDAPNWLFNKVAAYRGEPRYEMAMARHYWVDHRQGAFEFGAPTDVVARVTGRPAEDFTTTVKAYARTAGAQRTTTAFARALAEFMIAPLWRGYDHDRYEAALALPQPTRPLYAMHDDAWKAERHAQLTGQPPSFRVNSGAAS